MFLLACSVAIIGLEASRANFQSFVDVSAVQACLILALFRLYKLSQIAAVSFCGVREPYHIALEAVNEGFAQWECDLELCILSKHLIQTGLQLWIQIAVEDVPID